MRDEWTEVIVKATQNFLDELDKETDLSFMGSEDTRPAPGEHTPDYYSSKIELLKILREYRKANKR